MFVKLSIGTLRGSDVPSDLILRTTINPIYHTIMTHSSFFSTLRKGITGFYLTVACLILSLFPFRTASAQTNPEVETRIEDLLRRMTLEEKIDQMRHIHAYDLLENGQVDEQKLDSVFQGRNMGFIEAITLPGKDCRVLMHAVQHYMKTKTRLGIPIFTVTESLHGSVHDGSTIFPQAIALGSTFNPKLAYEMSSAIARELRAQGIRQSLSPVVDVCRELRWGRVEECFSEDPFLVSCMGLAQVKGYLDNGISPMIKHLGAHAAPQGGLNLASVACSPRELRSVYLQPFETIVRHSGLWAVMSSYNSWNGVPNSASKYLMDDLLRQEWGFKGYIYSDWGSIGMLDYFHHTAQNKAEAAMQALQAGMDAEASDNSFTELQHLVEEGFLDESYIDQAVRRILKAKFSLGLFEDEPFRAEAYDQAVHTQAHIALARQIAQESIVLLENRQHMLPLNPDSLHSIAVIGPNADQVQFGDYTWSRSNENGITLLEALKNRYGKQIAVHHARGCDLVSDDRSGFPEATEIVRKSDLSIVVVGSASASLARDYSNATCGEGFDLSDLTLTGLQEELIQAVYNTGKPLIVVLLAGKPFAIPWVKEHCPTIVAQWYPGEQGGEALVDMLFGKINPSGKLNYSFPQSVGHLPCFYNYLPTDKGFYHVPGKRNQPGKDYVFSSPDALWAFGHGLSYTEFDYLSANVSSENYTEKDTLRIRVNVRNAGSCDGSEVIQIYVRDMVSSVVQPIRELKAFQKVHIRRGDTARVDLAIPIEALALYDSQLKKRVEPGAFELQIGSASDDIRLHKTIFVNREQTLLIPTRENRISLKNTDTGAEKKSLTVQGTIRDVQANILPGITIMAGREQTSSDSLGRFVIQTFSSDTLRIEVDRFQPQIIPVNGRSHIDIQLIHR